MTREVKIGWIRQENCIFCCSLRIAVFLHSKEIQLGLVKLVLVLSSRQRALADPWGRETSKVDLQVFDSNEKITLEEKRLSDIKYNSTVL